MEEEIRVSADSVAKAIQKKIDALQREDSLNFIGKITVNEYGVQKKLSKVSHIYIHSINDNKPLNKPFEVEGHAKLRYKKTDGSNDYTEDGQYYIVRTKVTLTSNDNKIIVTLADNAITITDNKY